MSAEALYQPTRAATESTWHLVLNPAGWPTGMWTDEEAVCGHRVEPPSPALPPMPVARWLAAAGQRVLCSRCIDIATHTATPTET